MLPFISRLSVYEALFSHKVKGSEVTLKRGDEEGFFLEMTQFQKGNKMFYTQNLSLAHVAEQSSSTIPLDKEITRPYPSLIKKNLRQVKV